MATSPPTIAFTTVTIDTVTVALTPPVDPLYDHMLVFVYNVLTGALVHTSAPIFGVTYTTPALDQNYTYSVVAIAVDTGGENSLPSNQLVTAATNAHNSPIAEPKVVITAAVQESRTKVRIEYRLEDSKDHLFGELVNAEYSFNGLFSDSLKMQEANDARHEGRFDLEFRLDPMIINPHHFFIWDISEIPKNTVHEYKFRFRGKSGAVYSVAVDTDIDIDTTEEENIPVPVVIEDGDLLVTIPVFRNQALVTGAVVTVTEIRDDTDTDQLGGAVVLPELGATGVYQDTINLPIADFPSGRYRLFFTAVKAAADLSISDSKLVLVVEQDYDAAAQLLTEETCLIYGKLVDNLNRPLESATVTATYIREPSRYDRVSVGQITVQTNAYGFFALHLLRGTEATLEIPDLQYGERIRVPDQYTAQFSSIQFNQPSTLVRGPYGHVLPPEEQ